jgi:RNA polymerase sigma factor (sigma-70 family)
VILQALRFPTTSWSLVLAARQEQATLPREAVARLCQAYWYPVYGYIRSRGLAPEDARDLTQEFFLRLLDKQYLNAVDAPRGRFRWFLQAAVKRFLVNEYHRARAARRGGGAPLLSLEMDGAERRYSREPADPATPETVFDRRWSLLLLERALDRLRRDHEARGQGRLFEQLKPHLTGEAGSYRAAAEALGSTEGAVKVAVHRLRRRFAESLRQEIGETVASEDDIDAELRFLMDTLQ